MSMTFVFEDYPTYAFSIRRRLRRYLSFGICHIELNTVDGKVKLLEIFRAHNCKLIKGLSC